MRMMRTAAAADGEQVPGEHWLNAERVRLYSAVSLVAYVLFFSIWIWRTCLSRQGDASLFGGDFVAFWSAAQLALNGNPTGAYDDATLRLVEIAAMPALASAGGTLPWLYPPSFLLLVCPLALLTFGAAYGAFIGTTGALYLWAGSRIASWRGAWLPGMAFPGIAVVCATGQNALLTAGLAALSLTMVRRHPVAAGLVMGILTIKPHLALLFPLALVCARAWKALAAMAASSAALLALSASVFGTETFFSFLANVDMARLAVEGGEAKLVRMPTVFALVRLLGGNLALSYGIHAMVAALAAGVVIYAWCRPASFPLRASALMAATLMLSPYLYDYDLAFLGFVILWLAGYAIERGWMRWEKELLLVLWLTPLLGLLVVQAIGFQFMPLAILATLSHVVRRIRTERVQHPEPCHNNETRVGEVGHDRSIR
ncbi:glycosyltransferase family 87 protein [Cupriavidus basilensis]|uniref:glycosyltransferase family 87 protein n=1 Tax=Cupriavidus basilensis TaxID=68895 RepID=UPI0039F73F3F